jgi:5S rRNA maturation endonuclease (ribonuclease M5)
VNDIRKSSEEGAYIIVEGKNDKIALNAFNIHNNIIQIYANHFPLIHLERLIPIRSKVLLLTDFDEEGEALVKRLTSLLTSRNPRFLTQLRKNMREVVGPWVRTIEGLYRFYRRLQLLQSDHKHSIQNL